MGEPWTFVSNVCPKYKAKKTNKKPGVSQVTLVRQILSFVVVVLVLFNGCTCMGLKTEENFVVCPGTQDLRSYGR